MRSTAMPEASDWPDESLDRKPTVTLRKWLTFLRVHTSNLTQVGAMLGPLLAGVRDIPLLILFAIWGFCYHAWGFSDNNIQDYNYDKTDPAKQHFALIKGTIPIPKAKLVNILFFLPTLGIGLFLGYSNPASIALLLLTITAGMLYNRTCKKSLFAPIYITIAFTSVPLFTFFSVAQNWNLQIIVVSLYTMFLMLFQIAFEGYLKDLQSDPVNLLRSMGAYVKKVSVYFGDTLYLGRQKAFWITVKFANLLVGIVYFFLISTPDKTAIALYLLLGVGMAVIYDRLTNEHYDNKKVTSNAARMEILTYFALILMLQDALGWGIVLVLLVYPILWFMTLNRLTWKTFLRPRV